MNEELKNLSPKAKEILFGIAAACILLGALLGIIIDVAG